MARPFISGIVVVGFFIAVNVSVALVFLGLFTLGRWLAPDLMESFWFTYPLGFAALALGLWPWFWFIKTINTEAFQSRIKALGHAVARFGRE